MSEQRYWCPVCKRYVDVDEMGVDRKGKIVACVECGVVFNRLTTDFQEIENGKVVYDSREEA